MHITFVLFALLAGNFIHTQLDSLLEQKIEQETVEKLQNSKQLKRCITTVAWI
jgi:hypothetical protein